MPTIKTRGWKAGCTRLCRVSMLSTERYHWEDTGPPRALEMSIFMAAPSVTWTAAMHGRGMPGVALGTSTLLQWSVRCSASLELRISIGTVTLAAAQAKQPLQWVGSSAEATKATSSSARATTHSPPTVEKMVSLEQEEIRTKPMLMIFGTSLVLNAMP